MILCTAVYKYHVVYIETVCHCSIEVELDYIRTTYNTVEYRIHTLNSNYKTVLASNLHFKRD